MRKGNEEERGGKKERWQRPGRKQQKKGEEIIRQ